MESVLSYDELKPLWQKITSQYGHRRFGDRTFESWLEGYGSTLVQHGVKLPKTKKSSSTIGEGIKPSNAFYPSSITVNARLTTGSDIITKLDVPILSATWTNDVNTILSKHLGVEGQLVNPINSSVAFSPKISTHLVSNTIWAFKPSSTKDVRGIYSPYAMRYPKGSYNTLRNAPHTSGNLYARHNKKPYTKKEYAYSKVGMSINTPLITKKQVQPSIYPLPPVPPPMSLQQNRDQWANKWRTAVTHNIAERAGAHLATLETTNDEKQLKSFLKSATKQLDQALERPDYALATSSKRIIWLTISDVQHIAEAEAFRSVPHDLLIEADKHYTRTPDSKNDLTITWGTMLPIIVENESVVHQEARLLFHDFVKLFDSRISNTQSRGYLLELMKVFNENMKIVFSQEDVKTMLRKYIYVVTTTSESSDSEEDENITKKESSDKPPKTISPNTFATFMSIRIKEVLNGNKKFQNVLNKITNSNAPNIIQVPIDESPRIEEGPEEQLMLTNQKIGVILPQGLRKAAENLKNKGQNAINKLDNTLKNNDQKKKEQNEKKEEQAKKKEGKKMTVLDEKLQKLNEKKEKLLKNKKSNAQIGDRERPELVPMIVPIVDTLPFSLPALIPISPNLESNTEHRLPTLLPISSKHEMPKLIPIDNKQKYDILPQLEEISYTKNNRIEVKQTGLNRDMSSLVDLPKRPPLKKIETVPTNCVTKKEDLKFNKESESASNGAEEESSESDSDNETEAKPKGTNSKIGCTIFNEDSDNEEEIEKPKKQKSRKRQREVKPPLKPNQDMEEESDKEDEEDVMLQKPQKRQRTKLNQSKIGSLAELSDLASTHKCHIAYDYFHGSGSNCGVDLNNKVIILPPSRDFSRTTVTRIESTPAFKEQKQKEVVFDLPRNLNVSNTLQNPKVLNITGNNFNYSIDNSNFTFNSAAMRGAAMTLKIAHCGYYKPTNTMYLICSS